MNYFKTDKNIQIHYKFLPKKNKPTLIFIHGLALDHTCWQHFIENLKGDCGILCFDLRGHGLSSKPRKKREYQIKNFVDDSEKLIKHLKIKDFYLIGHSLGGLISSELNNRIKPNATILISTPIDLKDVSIPFYSLVKIIILIPKHILKIFATKKNYSDIKGLLKLYIKCLSKFSASRALKIISNIKRFKGLAKINNSCIIISKYDEIIKNHITQIYPEYIEMKGTHFAPIRDYEKTITIIKKFIKK
ncbi:MAG: alpha/beta fold hydrolase [Nanoarchaeota archaeon]|nr:alpha/beta fold hydrolase [Nanoarchaeota archaeon]